MIKFEQLQSSDHHSLIGKATVSYWQIVKYKSCESTRRKRQI